MAQEKDAGITDWLGKKLKRTAAPAGAAIESTVQRNAPILGKEMGREAAKSMKKELVPLLEQLKKDVAPTLEQAGRKSVEGATRALKDSASSAVRQGAGAAGIGGAAGALSQVGTQDPDQILHGGLRGAFGGLLGGVAGGSFGGKPLGVAGAAIGGGLGGFSGRQIADATGSELGRVPAAAKRFAMGKEVISSAHGNRFAGVTYDWYDDQGETLKQRFPTRDSLPDVIKTANIQPKEQLANEQFAVVMADRGHIFRKYACYDAGTTAMSAVYFMEHGDKLPEEAQKVAAANLNRALLQHGMRPPRALLKTAASLGSMPKMASDDTGSAPTAEQKGQIHDWIRDHASPRDEQFHQFLEGKGINPHLGEAEVYRHAHELSKKADAISGGKADKLTDKDFPKDQMSMGMKVEKEHTSNPALAKEISRDHLEEFPDYYTRLKNMEDDAEKGKAASVIDVTGMAPPTKYKVASPESDADYAVVMSNGERLYPINSWDLVKQAADYWEDQRRLMDPEIRHQFATKLAAKALQIGFPLDYDILEAGSGTYANQDHMADAIGMRKVACDPTANDREFLDELLEKSASIEPHVYAEVLRRFDVEHDLDHGWDHVILDPWSSTFGIDKTARVVWEDGADRVTDKALLNLAENHISAVEGQFMYDVAAEFKKDPVAIFNSMPKPQKKILSRLAMDSESEGGSEHGFTER